MGIFLSGDGDSGIVLQGFLIFDLSEILGDVLQGFLIFDLSEILGDVLQGYLV